VLPHETLQEKLREMDVFVFPSIVEGFGMVITEALAAGLPVITTPHTAGADIITEGHDGFIIPIRSPHAITASVTRLIEDEDLRLQMCENALGTASEMSWEHYESRIEGLVRAELSQQ
jgi:glycosyltransferase involved in cell wall biosynthesis